MVTGLTVVDTEWVKRESLTLKMLIFCKEKNSKNIALEVDLALCLNKQPLVQNKPPALKFWIQSAEDVMEYLRVLQAWPGHWMRVPDRPPPISLKMTCNDATGCLDPLGLFVSSLLKLTTPWSLHHPPPTSFHDHFSSLSSTVAGLTLIYDSLALSLWNKSR